MKTVISALLIAILPLGLHLNEGLAEHILSDLFNEEELGTLNRGENTEGLDPYFLDSEKITKHAEDDCMDYFGDKDVMDKDLFCGCAGRKTAALGKKPGPVEDHGECHYKLMLASGMWMCDEFISKEGLRKKIKNMFDSTIDEINAGNCQVKW